MGKVRRAPRNCEPRPPERRSGVGGCRAACPGPSSREVALCSSVGSVSWLPHHPTPCAFPLRRAVTCCRFRPRLQLRGSPGLAPGSQTSHPSDACYSVVLGDSSRRHGARQEEGRAETTETPRHRGRPHRTMRLMPCLRRAVWKLTASLCASVSLWFMGPRQ